MVKYMYVMSQKSKPNTMRNVRLYWIILLKTTNRILFWVQQKKKNNPGYQIFSRMFDIGLAIKKLQIGMTFTYMNIKIFSFQSQCHFISIVTGCQL